MMMPGQTETDPGIDDALALVVAVIHEIHGDNGLGEYEGPFRNQ